MRAAWCSWWRDPASTQWTEGDRDLVLHLADVYELWTRDGGASLAGEIRLLRDNLGLSPKGRQDRRWRVRAEGELIDFYEASAPAKRRCTRRLLAIDPENDSA